MSEVAEKRKLSVYGRKSYFDLIADAEKPIRDRRVIPIGRQGVERPLRRSHLLQHDIDQLVSAKKDGAKFPSPFNRTCYGYILETLAKTALNRRISLPKFVEAFKELTSDKDTKDVEGKSAWQRFKGKESRNEDTGLDYEDRLFQNIEVLQRNGGKTPYGLKIDQVAKQVLGTPGAAIDITVGDGKGHGEEIYISLNTNPQNFEEFTCEGELNQEAAERAGYKVTKDSEGRNVVKVAQPINQTKRVKKTDDEDAVEVASDAPKKTPKASKASKKGKAKARTQKPIREVETDAVVPQVLPSETVTEPEVVTESEPEVVGVIASESQSA